MLFREANRDAPAQAELRPTSPGPAMSKRQREGFIEQALGMLDPVIDQELTALREILRNSDL
jgi:hypothetical protein